jgi:nucleotide-binding universal stress UspA family protein
MTERLLSGTPPQRLLLATDLSSRGDRAFDRVVHLARAWQAELHIVHALKTPSPVVPAGVDGELFLSRYPDPGTAALRSIRRLLDHAGLTAGIHIEDASPTQAILSVAEREDCDLLVLGESRTGLSGLIDSTLEQVVRKAPVSVLVVRNRPHGAYRSLLVGTDFTDEAQQALIVAAWVFPSADITLLHAYTMPYAWMLEDEAQTRTLHEEKLANLRAQIDASGLTGERRESILAMAVPGAPAAVLGRYVDDENIDMTVIGAHPRGLLFDAMLGNSQSILGAIPGDILVVRAIRRGNA